MHRTQGGYGTGPTRSTTRITFARPLRHHTVHRASQRVSPTPHTARWLALRRTDRSNPHTTPHGPTRPNTRGTPTGTPKIDPRRAKHIGPDYVRIVVGALTHPGARSESEKKCMRNLAIRARCAHPRARSRRRALTMSSSPSRSRRAGSSGAATPPSARRYSASWGSWGRSPFGGASPKRTRRSGCSHLPPANPPAEVVRASQSSAAAFSAPVSHRGCPRGTCPSGRGCAAAPSAASPKAELPAPSSWSGFQPGRNEAAAGTRS